MRIPPNPRGTAKRFVDQEAVKKILDNIPQPKKQTLVIEHGVTILNLQNKPKIPPKGGTELP